jgi:RPA family protein
MPEQSFKRNVAYKLRIGDLSAGKPIIENERFRFLEMGNKNVVRINIIGNIVDKYESEGEKQYSFLTIDDGSGQIKIKAFGDDVERIKELNQGQTILLIGVLRYFNNELYISPEIVKEQDPKYLLIRKMEVEKNKPQQEPKVEKEEQRAVKDKILDLIKQSEDEGGIETEKIIMSLKETSPNSINNEIQKMLEEGIIFEPRPGKVRWLG